MRARKLRLRSVLLGAGFATASLALVALPSVGYSAWHSAVSVPETVSAATVPTPESASGVSGSTTINSSYPAVYGFDCPTIPGYTYKNVVPYERYYYCFYESYSGEDYTEVKTNLSHYCPDGGYLSGTTCYTNTTSPYLQFTWKTPTAYDASGQDFVTGVAVVEGSSCSTSSWKVVATAPPSADSYTIDNPSTSEYYGLQTIGIGGWTSSVSECSIG